MQMTSVGDVIPPLSFVSCFSASVPAHLLLISSCETVVPIPECCSCALSSLSQNLDLRVKWPNDIYFGDKQKVGGVLVTSSSMGRDIHALIGMNCEGKANCQYTPVCNC